MKKIIIQHKMKEEDEKREVARAKDSEGTCGQISLVLFPPLILRFDDYHSFALFLLYLYISFNPSRRRCKSPT